jgi:hypothetical protein
VRRSSFLAAARSWSWFASPESWRHLKRYKRDPSAGVVRAHSQLLHLLPPAAPFQRSPSRVFKPCCLQTFGVYGAGKAARHMLLVATPALEADMFHPPNRAAHGDSDYGQDSSDSGSSSSSSSSGGGVSGSSGGGSSGGRRHDGGGGAQQRGPRVRTLSYAPGAIDTEMQAAAREALPPIPLKAAFEANAAAGRLVKPADSAAALVRLLARPRGEVPNGSHWDYYDCCDGWVRDGEGRGGGGGGHPLDRPPATVVGAKPMAVAVGQGRPAAGGGGAAG